MEGKGADEQQNAKKMKVETSKTKTRRWTISDLTNGNEPDERTPIDYIRVKIICRDDSWASYTTYGGTTAVFLDLVVADGTGACRCRFYRSKKEDTWQANCEIIITNAFFRDQTITVPSTSNVYSTQSSMEIPKDIAQTASNLLQQPVHEFQAISKISTSPIKSKISIQGTLVQDEAVRLVGAKKTAVRDIIIQDQTTPHKVRAALWDDTAHLPVQTGDTLALHDATVDYNKFYKEPVLTVRYTTSVKITPAQDKTLDVEIIAARKDDQTTTSVIAVSDGEYETYHVGTNLLMKKLHVSTEEQITSKLPVKLSIKKAGNKILGFPK